MMEIWSIIQQIQHWCCIPAKVFNKQTTFACLDQPGYIPHWGVAGVGFYGNWHETDVRDKW